jgi:hypothetical protein
MTPKKYDFTKVKITPASEKSYNVTQPNIYRFDELCRLKIYGKTFNIGKLFYLYRSYGSLCFRLFGKYGLNIIDTTKTFTFFSERNNYKNFWDIGKYRIKILK